MSLLNPVHGSASYCITSRNGPIWTKKFFLSTAYFLLHYIPWFRKSVRQGQPCTSFVENGVIRYRPSDYPIFDCPNLQSLCKRTSSIPNSSPKRCASRVCYWPLLFLIYINDLADLLGENSLLYADDVKLIFPRRKALLCRMQLTWPVSGLRNGNIHWT